MGATTITARPDGGVGLRIDLPAAAAWGLPLVMLGHALPLLVLQLPPTVATLATLRRMVVDAQTLAAAVRADAGVPSDPADDDWVAALLRTLDDAAVVQRAHRAAFLHRRVTALALQDGAGRTPVAAPAPPPVASASRPRLALVPTRDG